MKLGVTEGVALGVMLAVIVSVAVELAVGVALDVGEADSVDVRVQVAVTEVVIVGV